MHVGRTMEENTLMIIVMFTPYFFMILRASIVVWR
jgi:hypothetical protein